MISRASCSDQTLYTQIAGGRWSELIYTLPCEWNRQISMQFGFGNRTIHACPRRCAILHANYKPLKCVAGMMQANPSCATWSSFWQRTSSQLRARQGPNCGGQMAQSWGRFTVAVKSYFSDCCI